MLNKKSTRQIGNNVLRKGKIFFLTITLGKENISILKRAKCVHKELLRGEREGLAL